MIKAWLRFRSAGMTVPLSRLFLMTLRRSLTSDLVSAFIQNHSEGLGFDQSSMEAHVLAGGDVLSVLSGASEAKRLGLEVEPMALYALDLAGKPVLEAVHGYATGLQERPELTFQEIVCQFAETGTVE